ncbi:hypothetical protein P8452_47620 [Trifolium repens]|nr:hypothetical protein P8452_47620 [Trifolium repens]
MSHRRSFSRLRVPLLIYMPPSLCSLLRGSRAWFPPATLPCSVGVDRSIRCGLEHRWFINTLSALCFSFFWVVVFCCDSCRLDLFFASSHVFYCCCTICVSLDLRSLSSSKALYGSSGDLESKLCSGTPQ